MPRPFTVLNVATGLDGRITTARRDLTGFGGPEDRDLMDLLRAEADAVLIGASTLRDENPALEVRSPERIAAREASGRTAQPVAVLISRRLEFPVAGKRFFAAPGRARWVFTGVGAPTERLREVGAVAEVEPLPAALGGQLDLTQVVARLHERGVRHLLLEGGGALNYGMLAAGLVDEIRLTLCPLVIGARTAPAAFDGPGFAAGQLPQLELISARPGAEGRLFLHYRVPGARALSEAQ